MKAACFTESGRLMEISEVPDPTPGPGEIVMRVKGCGICGSDLHVTETPGLVPAGAVMGHEFAGEIVAVGAGAVSAAGEPWREGDAVCTMPGISCGACEFCTKGDVMGCPSLRGTGFGDIGGGFAEYALGGGRMTFRLPESIEPADGAMVEPLAVGLHAVSLARCARGEDVLVVGAGPVGLAIALWAKYFGAREVVISDPVEPRRSLATRLGATASIDPSKEEVLPAYSKITGGDPTMIFECVGLPGMIQECASLVKRGGRVLSAGMCMQPDSFMPLVLGVKEVAVQFCSYYRHDDFALTIDVLAANRLDVSAMVTDRVELDALPTAFEALRTPQHQCKVIVQP